MNMVIRIRIRVQVVVIVAMMVIIIVIINIITNANMTIETTRKITLIRTIVIENEPRMKIEVDRVLHSRHHHHFSLTTIHNEQHRQTLSMKTTIMIIRVRKNVFVSI